MREAYWKVLSGARQALKAADARLKPVYVPWQQRGNQGCFAVDIHAQVGFFAQLNWCLTVLEHCKQHGLRPCIRMTSPAYADIVGEDWFGQYFVNLALTESDRQHLLQDRIKVSRIADVEQLGLCVFRMNSATDSTANWPPIPRESGHPFHGKLAA